MNAAKLGDRVRIHYTGRVEDGLNHPLAGRTLTIEMELVALESNQG